MYKKIKKTSCALNKFILERAKVLGTTFSKMATLLSGGAIATAALTSILPHLGVIFIQNRGLVC